MKISPRKRIMLNVALVVTLLTSIYSGLLLRQQHRFITELAIHRQNDINVYYSSLLQQIRSRYQSRLHSFATTKPEILAAFAARDRQQLLSRTGLFQETFKKEDPHFFSIFFITPENTNFLRLVKPDLHGDSVVQLSPLLVAANAEKKPMAAFEAVKMGMQFRLVEPVYFNGDYIGLIGFGINAEHFYGSFADATDLDLALVVERNQYDKIVFSHDTVQEFPSGMVLLKKNGFPILPEDFDFTRQVQQRTVNRQNYLFFKSVSFPGIHDNKEVGHLLFALNITSVYEKVKKELILTFLTVVLLLALSLAAIHHWSGKLLQQIITLNQSLADSNRNLENKVLERTRELEEKKQIARRSTRDWERTFDAVPELITILDTDRKIVRANKAMASSLQTAFDQLIGKHCYQHMHCPGVVPDNCPYTLLLQDHKHHHVELFDETSQRYFHVSVDPVFDDDGKLLGAVHIMRDITAVKAAEQERTAQEKRLQAAEKMEVIGALSGGIAHDFNNILSAVLGYGELSLLPNLNSEELRQNIREILKAGKRAKELVAQILTFSRQRDAAPQLICPAVIIKEALKMLASVLPATIEIRQDLHQNGGRVLADPSALHQIVMNLAINAYQAMGETGVLSVTLARCVLAEGNDLQLPQGDYFQLAVSDTGCGIPEDIQDTIFTPLFTTKKEGEGTGMGLSTVRGILTRCGGTVTLASRPGNTVFTVYLPIMTQEVQAGRVEAIRQEAPFGKGKKLLFVDDESALRFLGTNICESFGFQVITAPDGEEALRQFSADPESFDLLITDQNMPGMPGAALAAEILSIRPDIPVILCTGFSSVMNEETIKAIGIKKMVMKPVSMGQYAEILLELGFTADSAELEV